MELHPAASFWMKLFVAFDTIVSTIILLIYHSNLNPINIKFVYFERDNLRKYKVHKILDEAVHGDGCIVLGAM